MALDSKSGGSLNYANLGSSALSEDEDQMLSQQNPSLDQLRALHLYGFKPLTVS